MRYTQEELPHSRRARRWEIGESGWDRPMTPPLNIYLRYQRSYYNVLYLPLFLSLPFIFPISSSSDSPLSSLYLYLSPIFSLLNCDLINFTWDQRFSNNIGCANKAELQKKASKLSRWVEKRFITITTFKKCWAIGQLGRLFLISEQSESHFVFATVLCEWHNCRKP